MNQQRLWNLRGEIFATLVGIYDRKGDYQLAVETGETGLSLNTITENQRAWVMANLAFTITKLGDHQRTFDLAENGLKIVEGLPATDPAERDFTRVSKELIESSFYNVKGSAYYFTGAYGDALKFWEKATEIAKDSGDKRNVATSLNNVGLIRQITGDFKKALATHVEALKTREEIGDILGTAQSLNNIGNCYDVMGVQKKALEHFKKAARIEKKIGDMHGYPVILANIGHIYASQKDFRNAFDYYNEALKIHRKTGNIQEEQVVLGNIGEAHLSQGHIEPAIENLLKAVDISCRMEAKFYLIHWYGYLAAAYKAIKDSSNVAKYIKLCKSTAKEISQERILDSIEKQYQVGLLE